VIIIMLEHIRFSRNLAIRSHADLVFLISYPIMNMTDPGSCEATAT